MNNNAKSLKNVISTKLPCIFVNGRPKSINSMNAEELRKFIGYVLVLCDTKIPPIPNWWPPNVDCSAFIYNKSLTTEQLKQIIECCYSHYKQRSLLVFSEKLARFEQLKIKPAGENASAIYLQPNNKLLLITPNEHLHYDSNNYTTIQGINVNQEYYIEDNNYTNVLSPSPPKVQKLAEYNTFQHAESSSSVISSKGDDLFVVSSNVESSIMAKVNEFKELNQILLKDLIKYGFHRGYNLCKDTVDEKINEQRNCILRKRLHVYSLPNISYYEAILNQTVSDALMPFIDYVILSKLHAELRIDTFLKRVDITVIKNEIRLLLKTSKFNPLFDCAKNDILSDPIIKRNINQIIHHITCISAGSAVWEYDSNVSGVKANECKMSTLKEIQDELNILRQLYDQLIEDLNQYGYNRGYNSIMTIADNRIALKRRSVLLKLEQISSLHGDTNILLRELLVQCEKKALGPYVYFIVKTAISQSSTLPPQQQRSQTKEQLANEQAKITILKMELIKYLKNINFKPCFDGEKATSDVRYKAKLEEIAEKQLIVNSATPSTDCVHWLSSPAKNQFNMSKDPNQYIGRLSNNNKKISTSNLSTAIENVLHTACSGRPGENEYALPPAGVKTPLKPHQLSGLKWLSWREKQYPHGGIFADDMGTGKSLTILAFILQQIYMEEVDYEQIASANDNLEDDDNNDDDGNDGGSTKGKVKNCVKGGTLIVCPASVLSVWEGQIRSHFNPDAFSYIVYHNTYLKQELLVNQIASKHIVITTYGYVVSELSTMGLLHQIKWNRLILDEAHYARNIKTDTAKACKALLARHRWALTGTPIQNYDADIQALFWFLRFKPLDCAENFKAWVKRNTVYDLHRLLYGILLRRTKNDLYNQTLQLDKGMGNGEVLPKKKIKIISVHLNKTERKIYAHIEAQRLMHLDVCPLYILLRLRQFCNHPHLITMLPDDNDFENVCDFGENEYGKLAKEKSIARKRVSTISSPKNVTKRNENFNKLMLNGLLENDDCSLIFNRHTRSSKYQQVLKIIEDIDRESQGEDKIVIVSEWTSVLNLYGEYLHADNYKYLLYTGEMNLTEREIVIKQFNQQTRSKNDTMIMLLSLKAGGVGISLQGANHIVFIEPHPNPQLVAQAEDRIYRIGQEKQCYIYKLYTKNTVETRIKEIQKEKIELSDSVLRSRAPTKRGLIAALLPAPKPAR